MFTRMYTFFSIYTKYTLTKYGFEVIHKRNKYYLISIFLTQCEGGGTHVRGGGTLIQYQPTPSLARHFMPSTFY